MALSKDPSIPAESELDAAIRESFEAFPLPGAICFFCSEPVAHPAIYWHGSSRIWMHPRCAFGLAMGLLQDVERMDPLLRWEADR